MLTARTARAATGSPAMANGRVGVLAARRPDSTGIPVVDLRALRAGDAAAVTRVATRTGGAGRDVGFPYLRDHGVARVACERPVAATGRFFALPGAARIRCDIGAVQQHRGLVPDPGFGIEA